MMAKYTAKQIKDWDVSCEDSFGKWKPCRALNFKYDTYLHRLKYAFGVLVGKYDALDWEDN